MESNEYDCCTSHFEIVGLTFEQLMLDYNIYHLHSVTLLGISSLNRTVVYIIFVKCDLNLKHSLAVSVFAHTH